jgi:hypothetical protein
MAEERHPYDIMYEETSQELETFLAFYGRHQKIIDGHKWFIKNEWRGSGNRWYKTYPEMKRGILAAKMSVFLGRFISILETKELKKIRRDISMVSMFCHRIVQSKLGIIRMDRIERRFRK